MTKAESDEREPSVEDEMFPDATPEMFRKAFMQRAEQARQFAFYEGPVRKDAVTLARYVANTWKKLVLEMEERASTERRKRRRSR